MTLTNPAISFGIGICTLEYIAKNCSRMISCCCWYWAFSPSLARGGGGGPTLYLADKLNQSSQRAWPSCTCARYERSRASSFFCNVRDVSSFNDHRNVSCRLYQETKKIRNPHTNEFVRVDSQFGHESINQIYWNQNQSINQSINQSFDRSTNQGTANLLLNTYIVVGRRNSWRPKSTTEVRVNFKQVKHHHGSVSLLFDLGIRKSLESIRRAQG